MRYGNSRLALELCFRTALGIRGTIRAHRCATKISPRNCEHKAPDNVQRSRAELCHARTHTALIFGGYLRSLSIQINNGRFCKAITILTKGVICDSEHTGIESGDSERGSVSSNCSQQPFSDALVYVGKQRHNLDSSDSNAALMKRSMSAPTAVVRTLQRRYVYQCYATREARKVSTRR